MLRKRIGPEARIGPETIILDGKSKNQDMLQKQIGWDAYSSLSQ